MADAIAVLKQQGAIVVDPADIPSFVEKDRKNNFATWDFCSGAEHAKGHDADCSVNFKYGMKRDFNLWLKSLGPSAPVKTLTELREWNRAHEKAGAIRFGQSRLDISDEMDLEKDRARNDADVEKDRQLSRAKGIDGVLKANNLDAFVSPADPAQGSPHAPAIRSSSFRSARCRMRRHPATRPASTPRPRRSASASPAPRAASRASSSSRTRSSRPPGSALPRRRPPEV